jgi:hypothetical protein
MGYDRSHKGPGPRKFINSHNIDAENFDFCFLTIAFIFFCFLKYFLVLYYF